MTQALTALFIASLFAVATTIASSILLVEDDNTTLSPLSAMISFASSVLVFVLTFMATYALFTI